MLGHCQYPIQGTCQNRAPPAKRPQKASITSPICWFGREEESKAQDFPDLQPERERALELVLRQQRLQPPSRGAFKGTLGPRRGLFGNRIHKVWNPQLPLKPSRRHAGNTPGVISSCWTPKRNHLKPREAREMSHLLPGEVSGTLPPRRSAPLHGKDVVRGPV